MPSDASFNATTVLTMLKQLVWSGLDHPTTPSTFNRWAESVGLPCISAIEVAPIEVALLGHLTVVEFDRLPDRRAVAGLACWATALREYRLLLGGLSRHASIHMPDTAWAVADGAQFPDYDEQNEWLIAPAAALLQRHGRRAEGGRWLSERIRPLISTPVVAPTWVRDVQGCRHGIEADAGSCGRTSLG